MRKINLFGIHNSGKVLKNQALKIESFALFSRKRSFFKQNLRLRPSRSNKVTPEYETKKDILGFWKCFFNANSKILI